MELFPDRVGVPPAQPSAAVRELAAWLPPGLRMGTSSWSFPGWVGQVWGRPASREVLAEHGLAAYARHPLFRTVSVDRSYYGPVPEATWQRYAEAVPDDFRFVVKAAAVLTRPTVEGGVNPRFLDPDFAVDAVVGPVQEGLGPKWGGLLLQIPPGPPPREWLGRLDALLDTLQAHGVQAAVEPRLRGGMGPNYAACLAAHGAVHVLSVHPAMPDLRAQWRQGGIAEAPSLWVRWNLGHGLDYATAKGRYAPFDRRVAPDDDVQEALAKAIAWALRREREVVVIANNKAEGSAPATLVALAAAVRGHL